MAGKSGRTLYGYPVLILGGGRGGLALLEMFLEDEHVAVLGIVDPDAQAPGIRLAQTSGIPVFSHVAEALPHCRDYPDCIVYNLTHDDSVAAAVSEFFAEKKVTSGPEAKLFWQIVTNLKRIKLELENSQNQLNAIIRHAMDGIVTLSDHGVIHGFNPAAELIFGYSQEEVLGKPAQMLVTEATEQDYRFAIDRYLATHERGNLGIRGLEIPAIRKSGEIFPIELSASEMEIKGQRFFVAIVRDITERKIVERKIQHLAHHDFLTGLPNRTFFLDQVDHALNLAKRHKQKAALLFLDLDGFKQVNDTLGHDAGDLLLQEVAQRLKTVIRASDIVARIGGDEFTFILHDIESREDAEAVAEKILDALRPVFYLNEEPCPIGGSIGIAMYPDHAETCNALLRKADEAMYLAKKGGKNACRVWE